MTVKAEELIVIGQVTRASGVRGEVKITPLTDNPDRFNLLSKVTVETNNAQLRVLELEKVRVRKGQVFLKFLALNDRTEAESIRGALIKIPRKECLPLDPDCYYIFDLIGLQVKSINDEQIGIIMDVMSMPANDVYIVRNGDKEYLIPAIADVVKKVDIDGGQMIIDPIDGLLT